MPKAYRDTKETSLRMARVASTTLGKFNGILERAARGESTPIQAIKAKCIECCGLEEVTTRVAECTTYSCPLHAYRPYQVRARESDD